MSTIEPPNAWKRPFFVFWGAQAVSQIGSGLASFALIWWMTQSTGSATVLTTAVLLTFLPKVLVGPLAGALVDRTNRKWVMILADGTSALIALLLVGLFWSGGIQIWHIYLITAVRGLAEAFQFPAMQSSTSLMAPPEQLARVAGLNQALQGVLTVATPPLGALILTILPMHTIMGIDVATAAIAIGLLFIVRIPQPSTHKEKQDSSVLQDIRAGMVYLLRWPAMLGVTGIAGLINLVITPVSSLVPLLVTRHFGGGALLLGWMEAAFGLGLIGGGVLLGAWGGFKRRILTSLLGLAGIAIALLLIGIAPANGYGIALAGMMLMGAMNTLCNGPFLAIVQTIVPPEMQGRVLTVLISVAGSMAAIGMPIAGPLTDRFGLQFWFVIGAGVCLAIVAWMALSPGLLHMEDEGRRIAVTVDGDIGNKGSLIPIKEELRGKYERS